jgi:hypothetical protein
MRAYPTPSEAALEAFGVSDARAVCSAVEGDHAAVIVLAPAYDPPATLLYRVTRGHDGWRMMGAGPLGLSWGQPTGPGEHRVSFFGVETAADVIEVNLQIDQTFYVIPTPGGYGVVIIHDGPTEPSWKVTSYRTVDGCDVEGSPPPVRTFNKQADPAQLAAIGDARHFVWAAQLQIERYIAAFRGDMKNSLVPPTTYDQRRSSQVFAEAEFLLNAAAQASKALQRLGGPQFSHQMATDIRLLRDLHEHWEQHKASFAHPSLTKSRAGKDFAARHPDERPWVFQFGSGGHWISVLRLEDLWDELELIDRELGRLSNSILDGTAVPHVLEDDNRPLRPMPEPTVGRVLARSIVTQPILIGEPEPTQH